MKSRQAAEALAMVDLTGACMFYKVFICEILHIDILFKIPVICKTDNSRVHSATQILDKRLRMKKAILRDWLGLTRTSSC